MIIQRLFSLESGSYSGSKRTPRSLSQGIANSTVIGGLLGAALGGFSGGKVLTGGLIGAGLGAVSMWLSNITDQSVFNSKINDRYSSYDFIDEIDRLYNKQEEDSEITTSETE